MKNFDKIGFSAQINSIKNENLTTIDLNSNQYNGIKYTFEYCDGRNKNYFKIIRYSNPDSICKKLFNKMEEL